MVNPQSDGIEKLVTFLSKRDGIDKLVKTFQYVSKLANWRLQETHPDFLQTNLDGQPILYPLLTTGLRICSRKSMQYCANASIILVLMESALFLAGNSGDIIYFLFDHMSFLARIGFINKELAGRLCHISAFGESVSYLGFIALCLIDIKRGRIEEVKILSRLQQLRGKTADSAEPTIPRLLPSTDSSAPVASPSTTRVRRTVSSGIQPRELSRGGGVIDKVLQPTVGEKQEEQAAVDEEIKKLEGTLSALRLQRLFHCLTISANVADLIIAIAEIEPNPFCNHPLVFGVSGLVSAWSGWYKLWPP